MSATPAAHADAAAEKILRLRAEIEKALRGKSEVVRAAVETLIGGGHLLIEDVPGVGKTTLAQAIARALQASFNRIQFTSDLLPGDVVGGALPDPERGGLALGFHPGPIFAHVVLADEINRASPKTQSALLEAMAESAVTVDGERHELPQPFFVVATQNPFDYRGTFPLPESQLDRFQRRISVGYPSREDERRVLEAGGEEGLVEVEAVLDVEELRALQNARRQIKLEESVSAYLLDVVDATRNRDEISLGVSTRGALALRDAAQSRALVDGRDYCIPEDVRETAASVLSHRLVLEGNAGTSVERGLWIVDELLDSIPVPL